MGRMGRPSKQTQLARSSDQVPLAIQIFLWRQTRSDHHYSCKPISGEVFTIMEKAC